MENKKWGLSFVFGILFILSLNIIYAEKLNIEIGNNYIPGEEVVFKIVLYDDSNKQIDGEVDYIIYNYYTEIVKEGVAFSGKEVAFKLPEDAIKGPWEISASYNGVDAPRTLFNVGELEKVMIKLEGDNLIVTNIGNSPIYDKKILIYIGNKDQTALVSLEKGQTKRIRLTAPEGNYDIRVIGEDEIVFKDVSLTGNVVGLERVVGDNFWQKYPLISLFFMAVGLLVIFVIGLRFYNKHS
jgi:hypothetical protein